MGSRGPGAGDGDGAGQSVLVPRVEEGVQIQRLVDVLVVPVNGLALGGGGCSGHVQGVATRPVNGCVGVTVPTARDEGVFLHWVEIVW